MRFKNKTTDLFDKGRKLIEFFTGSLRSKSDKNSRGCNDQL